MALWKWQLAGATAAGTATLNGAALDSAALHDASSNETERRQPERRIVFAVDDEPQRSPGLLVYGGVLLGVLAGAAISTYMWWQRAHHTPLAPLEEADELISNCENRLNELERAIEEWQASRE